MDDFEAWRSELIFTGAIVQDSDLTVSRHEAARRCVRYCELVNEVSGDEGRSVFDALLESMSAAEDYEVYETTVGALYRFPPALRGTWLFENVSWFYALNPEVAGDLLSLLVNNGSDAPGTLAFQRAWADAADDEAEAVARIVDREERLGWLSNKPWRLRPLPG